jgi:EPS-associated MarR family transcriptional regulator
LNAPLPEQALLSNPSAPENAELEVMRLLGTQPEMTQRKVASSLGMSLGKANYCLRALIAKGFVKAENYRNSSNKLAYFYLLTPSGIAAKAELTRQFLALKMREYEELGVEIERLKQESRASENGR